MNTSIVNVLTKAAPLSARQFSLRVPSTCSMRPFSTTTLRTAAASSRDKNRELEKQFLNPQNEQSKDDSPLSAITRMMQGEAGRPSQNVSRDYSRMAESLEAEILKQPYADRSPPHHLHVYAHKHNTVITLTRPNGSPLFTMSCGNLGFRKGGRAGFDPAYQLSAHVFAQIQERGLLLQIQRLDIIFRGFALGREAFTKVLLGNEGKNVRGLVSRVTDATRIKFGGTRSRKVRRLG